MGILLFNEINPLKPTLMMITVNVKQLLQSALSLGILFCSAQFLNAQIFGRLQPKAPMYQDISQNAMYSLLNVPDHRAQIDVVNLYSGNYNIQVMCQWKDMYRAKDMGTDRSFLIRMGDVVQLDNNLSQMNQVRYDAVSARYVTQNVSSRVPECIDRRYTGIFSQTSNPIMRDGRTPVTTLAPTSRIHVVQPKETLYRIGRKYGIPHQEIMAVNGMTSTRLSVGQRLRIERSSMPASVARQNIFRSAEPLPIQPPLTINTAQQSPTIVRQTTLNTPGIVGSANNYHTVRKGETLSSIGRKYGLSAAYLASVNGISNPKKLGVGTVLNLTGLGIR